MDSMTPGRGARAAPHRRGARALHIKKRRQPRIIPTACLDALSRRILAALASGPKTLGELTNYHLLHVSASARDEAIAELLRAGRVRLTEIPHPHGPHRRAMPAVRLASKGGDRG